MTGPRTELATPRGRAESLGPEPQADAGRKGCQSRLQAGGLRPENKIQLYSGLIFAKAGAVT